MICQYYFENNFIYFIINRCDRILSEYSVNYVLLSTCVLIKLTIRSFYTILSLELLQKSNYSKEIIMNHTHTLRTKQLTTIALMTAITCILAPLAIPIPISPVPITLTNLVLYISIFILGWRSATISYFIYLLLGLVGLPVFSGFAGGPGKLFGPTGGYLIGFIFLLVLSGWLIEHFNGNTWLNCGAMILGALVTYAFGTTWLSAQLDLTFLQGLAAGVFPYLIGDAVKILIALLVGPILQKRLNLWHKISN